MLYNILKDQWQTIEIDRIRSITQETEFSQMAELLYARVQSISTTIGLWVGRHRHHVSVKNFFFLRDLKESGEFSIIMWLPSGQDTSDLYTKNLDGPGLMSSSKTLCRDSQGRVLGFP